MFKTCALQRAKAPVDSKDVSSNQRTNGHVSTCLCDLGWFGEWRNPASILEPAARTVVWNGIFWPSEVLNLPIQKNQKTKALSLLASHATRSEHVICQYFCLALSRRLRLRHERARLRTVGISDLPGPAPGPKATTFFAYFLRSPRFPGVPNPAFLCASLSSGASCTNPCK